MLDAKTSDIPMAFTMKLNNDNVGIGIEETKYRGMIGLLMYLTVSKPNIMFSVGMCARFKSKPMKSHLKTIMWILYSLKGTMNLVLWYPASS